MSTKSSVVQRPFAVLSALALVAGSVASVFLTAQKVEAYTGDQVQSRLITLSSSTPSASNVTYKIGFKTATTGVIQGIAIDFCGGNVSDTPMLGDSNCTLPTGMVIGTTVTNPTTGLSPASTWAGAVVNSGHTLSVTNSSGASVAANTTIEFEVGGFTNASTTGTFYARIATYDTTAGSAGYTSADPDAVDTVVDYGGIALSTVSPVNVTAKVMETLTFCASDASITTCATTTAPSINLGRTVGTQQILDTGAVYTDNAYTQLSTNAIHGAIVRLKTTSSSACGGLSKDSGVSCVNLPAVASGATTPVTIVAGTAAFGICVDPADANTTAALPYNDSGCDGEYGLDDSSATKTTSTYGSPIFSTAGPVNQANDTLEYAATASNVTPAAIYTTTQSLIATGTY